MKRIILFIALMLLSGCADVDKALYSVSDNISSVDRVTGERTANFTSRASQIQQGNQAVSQLINDQYLSKGEKINADLDPAAYKRLSTVFDKVHSVSHMRNEKWDAYLIPDPSFNAFTTGGTVMVVNKGLMDQVQSDDELAAVIGHEIAHVAANHVFEKKAHDTAALVTNSKSVKRSSYHAAFQHEEEEEADRVGMLYATLAGYDPAATGRLWQRMYNNEGDFSARVVDHPVNSERADMAGKLAAIYKKYYMPGKINPDFAAILQNNEVFGHGAKGASSQPAAGQGGGLLSVLELVADGLNTHYAAKAEETRQQNQVMLVQQTQQNLQIVRLTRQGTHSLIATFQYTGGGAVKNLTLLGVLGDQQAHTNIANTIGAGNTFGAEFSFPSLDINRVDINAFRWGLQHAERL